MSAHNNHEWPHLSGTIADHLIPFLLCTSSESCTKSSIKRFVSIARAGFILNKNYEATITKTKCKIRMSSVLTSLSWKCIGVVYNPQPASTLNNPNPTLIFSSVNYSFDPPSPCPPPLAPWQGTVHKHDTIT